MAKTSGISPENILEVAEAILAVKGAKETTLRDIAKAVGISKGTLYYHYATKEALLYDIIGHHFDQVVNRLGKLAARSTRVDREDLLALMLEDLGEQRQINRLHVTLLAEMLAGDKDMREKYVTRYREWEQSVRTVLSRLYGPDHPATELAAGLLLTFVEGHAVRGTLLEESGAYRDMAGILHRLFQT